MIDPTSNAVIATVMYVDTFPPHATFVNPCVSGVTNITYGTSYGGPQVSTVIIPPAYHGQQVLVSVIAANQGDNAFDSPLHVDNFRWILPPAPTGAITRASLGFAKQSNGASAQPHLSADGRFVAFDSGAENLVPGDTNGVRDVFVRDRQTGTTEIVSVSSAGVHGNANSRDPSISGDGRFVVFESWSYNLVANDTNNRKDIFLHDRLTGTTVRLNVSATGAEADRDSWQAVIATTGDFIAFESRATNLVTGDTNDKNDIYVVERLTGAIERVSISVGGPEANADCKQPAISAGGLYIAFETFASSLIPGDTNKKRDIIVRDRILGHLVRVSVDSAGGQSNQNSAEAALSFGGRFIAFESRASNLVLGDTNGKADVFVHDLILGTTERVSVDSTAGQGNGTSSECWISGSGQYVVFESRADNLVLSDNNDVDDIFLHNRQNGETRRISINATGVEGNDHSRNPVISINGLIIGFVSSSTNLVLSDTNIKDDIFISPN